MIKAVGLFLLLLLKIVGWALLILLLVLVISLLLLLFVPVRYDVLLKNDHMDLDQKNLTAHLQLRLKVNWLLHFLQVTVMYGPDGLSNEIRVAGIDLPKLLARRAEKKESVRNSNQQKKSRHTVRELEKGVEVKAQKEVLKEPSADEETFESLVAQEQHPEHKNTDQRNADTFSSKEEPMNMRQKDSYQKAQTDKDLKSEHSAAKKKSRKQKSADTQKTGIFGTIRMQLQRLHKEYTDEGNRHAVGRLWIELLKLLRSYKPRKLKADVAFSLSDPALTGAATGLISLMPVIYRYPCSVVPDFTSEKLYVEGEIAACGKVRVFVFLCSVLRLIRDKKFMQVVRRLMKRGGTQ